MACCITKKEKTSSTVEFDTLKKYFDEVILEKREKYQLLTLRDKANRINYDYVVWLQIKFARANDDYMQGYMFHSQTDEEILSEVCKSILEWIDILKDFERKKKSQQLSLFYDDNKENELESEPPTPSSDGNWNSYFKKREEVRKRNLMKKFSFFDLLSISSHLYTGIDYRKKLPSTHEVRKLLKKALLKGKEEPRRHDEFWFDYPNFLREKDGMSDYELIHRLQLSTRLFLLPYKNYFRVITDLSFSHWEMDDHISYRYYLDGNKLSTNSAHDYDKRDLPTYNDLYDSELIAWVRKVFKIPYKKEISDEDVLRENLKQYFLSVLWYKKDEYDFSNKINTFKDWKHFKADFTAFLKLSGIKPSGGGSGYGIDGFTGRYDASRKGNIVISQTCKIREELNRNINGLKVKNDEYIVFNLTGDDLFKKGFELLSKKSIRQISLFDFAA